MITLELDEVALQRRIENRLETRVQLALDIEVLKDSNYYVPYREGTLMRSGHIPEPGTVEWDEEYAKAQYHGLENKSTDMNPNATMLWFEHAKARELRKWERISNEAYT